MISRSSVAEQRLDKAQVGCSNQPAGTRFISVWRSWERIAFGTRGSQVRDLPPRPDRRALGRGRSSMEEPWAVNPLVPVRLRPVTPKRMPSSTTPRGGTGIRNGLRSRGRKACPFNSDRGDQSHQSQNRTHQPKKEVCHETHRQRRRVLSK